MSSMLTLSVQPTNDNSNSSLSSSSSSSSSSSTSLISPIPPSSLSPCQTSQPQVTAPSSRLSSVPLVRNGRKRPALNLPPLHLAPALEHRRRENDARLRDTKAHIEASFLSEGSLSSPGGYSNDSQPSGSDDDSSQSSINSALCSSAKFEKRLRFDSTVSATPSCFTSLDSLEGDSGSSSVKVHHEPLKVLGADEYDVIIHGEEFQVLERSTSNLFHAQKMDSNKYKHFMRVAARIELAKKFYSSSEFSRIKSKIIPSDTRIVHGSHGISYLLTPSPHGSLNTKVKDSNSPKDRIRLSEFEVQSIVLQLVEMMELCHKVGIYFGDFKFDKFVFVDSAKTQIRPRSLLIFHLSKKIDDDTMFGTKVGWAYMAPELLNRRQTPYSGVAADMWALGVLAFTLLVGNYPFIANEPQTLFTRIRSRCITAKIEHFASTEARVMVFGLLCKNPSDRPSAERLKQCHWLQMSAEDFSKIATKPSQPSECRTSPPNFISHLMSLQFQQHMFHQQQQQQQRIGLGSLPRVHSDRRLNRSMEHHRNAAISRNQFSLDQVVPVTAPVLSSHPSTNICLFDTTGRR